MISIFQHKRWTQIISFTKKVTSQGLLNLFSSWSRLFLAILIVSIYFQWDAEKTCYNTLQKTQLFFGFFVSFLVILIVSIFSEMLKQCAKRACYNTLQKHDLLTALPFEDNKFDCLISVAVTTYLSKYFLKINGKALIRPILFIRYI